jgi:hypothetical protein
MCCSIVMSRSFAQGRQHSSSTGGNGTGGDGDGSSEELLGENDHMTEAQVLLLCSLTQRSNGMHSICGKL